MDEIEKLKEALGELQRRLDWCYEHPGIRAEWSVRPFFGSIKVQLSVYRGIRGYRQNLFTELPEYAFSEDVALDPVELALEGATYEIAKMLADEWRPDLEKQLSTLRWSDKTNRITQVREEEEDA